MKRVRSTKGECGAPPSPDQTYSDQQLRVIARGLVSHNPSIVLEAANSAKQLRIPNLCDRIAHALEVLMNRGERIDSDRRIGVALVQMLGELGHVDPSVLLAGLQLKGQTFASLRAACATALLKTDIGEELLLIALVDLLGDTDAVVRVAAIQALAASGAISAHILIRAKVVLGDPEPEVLASCFSLLLELDAPKHLSIVAKFAEANTRISSLALHALSQCHDIGAVDYLVDCWTIQANVDAKFETLAAIGNSVHADRAIAFLTSLLEGKR